MANAETQRQTEIRSRRDINAPTKRAKLSAIANECKQTDPMAPIKVIRELNLMDGDHAESRLASCGWSFDVVLKQMSG